MNIEIANRLQALRKQKNLSQEELAEKIGVTRQAVSKWERAEASPDTENLILLAKLYDISLDELLKVNGESVPESGGISLKKADYGFSGEEIKEMRPENYTEEEIYPGRPEAESTSIPQGAPFGADISDEERKSAFSDENAVKNDSNLADTLEKAGRALGDVLNAAGKKVEEGLKKADEEIRKANAEADRDPYAAENNSENWEKKFKQDMEKFGESMEKMGKDIERQVESAFANKHEHKSEHTHCSHKEKEPATLFDKLFPLIITFLFLGTIPLHLAHPGWTLFLLIPLYYTTKEAIRKRNPMVFCYPVFCVLVYCVIGGFLDVFIPGLSDNWYGFMWLIFLTIPLYYTIFPAIKKRNPLVFCYPVLCVMVYIGMGMVLDWISGWLGGVWFSLAWAPIFLSIPVYYIVLSHYQKKKNS